MIVSDVYRAIQNFFRERIDFSNFNSSKKLITLPPHVPRRPNY